MIMVQFCEGSSNDSMPYPFSLSGRWAANYFLLGFIWSAILQLVLFA